MGPPRHTTPKLDHLGSEWRDWWRERERERKAGVYILFSLEAFPPEIFCTLNWPSSVFSSRSCFWRSSFDLPHNWTVLILVVFDYLRVSPMRFFQSRVSFFFYHLVWGLSVGFAQKLWCRFVNLCSRSSSSGAQNILGCAAVPTLMVVKR